MSLNRDVSSKSFKEPNLSPSIFTIIKPLFASHITSVMQLEDRRRNLVILLIVYLLATLTQLSLRELSREKSLNGKKRYLGQLGPKINATLFYNICRVD